MVDLLALRRRTKIDCFINSVPQPPNSIPINALPGWENVPLGSKLPMLNCPADTIIFTRKRLGERVDKSPGIVFRLSNRYGKPNYDPLHDPSLQKYLYKKRNLEFLHQTGQLTRYNDVICTLRDFNEYRKYLEQIRLEDINYEIKKCDELRDDRRMFKKIQDIIENDFAKQVKQLKRQIKKEQLEMEAKQKFEAYQENKQRKIRDLEGEREQIRMIKKEIFKFKQLEHNRKLQKVNDERRIKLAKLKRHLIVKEARRIRNMKAKQKRIAQEKAEKLAQQFSNAIQIRHEHQLYNESLLAKNEAEMKERIERRKQKDQFIRERVQFKILQAKINLIRGRYESMELERLIQVVEEEIERKIKKEKILEKQSKLTDFTERAGLSPIAAPYRTPPESEAGLGDPPKGYSLLTKAMIRQVLESCSRNEKILNGRNYSTMEVLLTSKYIFDRIAEGATDDLPNDPEVLKFTITVVDCVINRVKTRIYNAMLTMINYDHSESCPKIKSTSTLNRNVKSSKISNVISFKGNEDKSLNSRIKALVLEKYASLRTMTRSALCTPLLSDDLPVPEELDSAKLFHLSKQQKSLIVRNLNSLEIMLALRLEKNVIARFDIHSKAKKRCRKRDNTCHELAEPELSDDVYKELMGRAMTSVLTKPETDEHFSENILALSDFLAAKVLEDLENYVSNSKLEKVDEEGESEAKGEEDSAETDEEETDEQEEELQIKLTKKNN